MSKLLNQKCFIRTLLLVLMVSTLSGGCTKEERLTEAMNMTIVLHEIRGEKCKITLNGKILYNKTPPPMDLSTAVNDTLEVVLRDGDKVTIRIGSNRVSKTIEIIGDEQFLFISSWPNHIEVSMEEFLMLD